MTRVVICGGVGGVGKTTTSAALAVGLALAGERVVVLTIDPARRLADALGLESLGNRPVPVPLDSLSETRGSLHALMLDRKATWDEVVERHSADAAAARALLENRYYRAVSTRLTGSHEYMATEKLYDLAHDGRWDVVVVDTPPTQHALSFFQAPARIRDVLDGRLIRALVEPGKGLFAGATRRVSSLVGRIAGDTVIDDIAEFFRLIGGLSAGFRARGAAVHQLLHSERTQFYLVTSASAPDRADALAFLGALREQKMHLAGLFVNRVRSAALVPAGLTAADLPRPAWVEAGAWEVWQEALLSLPELAATDARRHRGAIDQLAAAAGGAPLWALPEMPGGVRTLAGLAQLSRRLPPTAEPWRP